MGSDLKERVRIWLSNFDSAQRDEARALLARVVYWPASKPVLATSVLADPRSDWPVDLDRTWMPPRGTTARQFLIAFGQQIAGVAKDAETMSAAAVKRKHGADVRECRAKLKRLKELSAAREANEDETREVVGFLAAVLARNHR